MYGVAWLHNAPNVEQTLQDSNTSNRHQLIEFINSVVCTYNPAVLPDGSNLEMHLMQPLIHTYVVIFILTLT